MGILDGVEGWPVAKGAVKGSTYRLYSPPSEPSTKRRIFHMMIVLHQILHTRHAFLRFCRQNDYQFDSKRRAKHATMMVRGAEAFLHCAISSKYHTHNCATVAQFPTLEHFYHTRRILVTESETTAVAVLRSLLCGTLAAFLGWNTR